MNIALTRSHPISARDCSKWRFIIELAACLFFCIGSAHAADAAITGEGWEKSPAVSCAKAQKEADSYAESRCRFDGGVALRFPSGCKTVDVSESWGGKPMFHSTVSLGAVTCNGKKENQQPDVKARAEKDSKAKQRDGKSPEANSIDDAFAKMEKQNGKAPVAKAGNIDTQFAKLESFRTEQENLRKAEVERIAQRPVRIANFRNEDRVNSRVVEIKGDTQGYAVNENLMVHFNNVMQQVRTDSRGEYSTKVVLKSGSNAIRICFKERCSALNLRADIEALALMATLTWEGRGDLDLHVNAPDGRTCSFQSKHLPGVCNLDIDDTRGSNPENISVPLGSPSGNYRFWVVNFSGSQGVNGVLKVYKNEQLVETKNFVTSGGSQSTVVSVDLANVN